MFFKSPNITIAAIIALMLIGAAAYFSNISAVWHKEPILEKAVNDMGGNPYLGRDNAKVTIVEFYDFQCPSCMLFHSGAGNAMLEEYVKKGLARIVYKDFPFLGEESFNAAYAARCANEQGKFFEYQDRLFSKQANSFSHLSDFAEEVGANRDLFENCLSAGKYKDAVAKDLEDGKAAGVTATPTIFINGRKMEGALMFEDYKKVIEEELKK